MNTVHPDIVLDDFDEAVDEPNFNNPNTSPDPPSPYADLEKKYRKNRFNKSRNRTSAGAPGVNGQTSRTAPGGAEGNRVQKRKPKKKSAQKSFRSPSGRRNA